jgi:hypothetical protein
MVSALTVAKEFFKEEGLEVSVVFDGAGTRWVG